LEDYTALENVLMPARIARQDIIKGSSLHQRGLELLDKVGLKPRADFLAKFLSGGEKQRVAIARALCNDPSLILADEPSGNLDEDTSEIIHRMLLDFSKQPNKALIVVTHNQRLASECSLCYTLDCGHLFCKSGLN
jgi:lipoprotein-releasing system ATP-binding protein